MTWEYLAGFFDGEGCIHYAQRSYGRYVHVHISQGDVNERNSGVLQQVYDFLCERGIAARWNVYEGGRKVVVTNAPGSIAWLDGMLPYLIVKRAQAESAIVFAKATRKRQIEKRLRARIGLSNGDG